MSPVEFFPMTFLSGGHMLTNPSGVAGAWRLGWVLDTHTISSIFLGHDEAGREQFATTRSELGELVYRLKYRGDAEAADAIAGSMEAFLRLKPIVLSRTHLIASVPASTRRPVQPVELIANRLAARLGRDYSGSAVTKVRDTPSLKGVVGPRERWRLVQGAFTAKTDQVEGRGVLLIDDLYDSGSTANAVTRSLLAAGASRVYFLAATRTRRYR